MKTYNAVYKEQETEGVFGISLVENPAMEGQFIALSKEKIQFKEVDSEKRILIGLVLEPNKPIYRNQGGAEYNIVFNEDTIRNLSYNFFKANHHKNSTIEHETPIEGVTFVESWIVEDPKQDKSAVYGFSYPKGSWVATMKVDSEDVWTNFVKEGKVLGFSIDAMIKLEEVKSNISMKEEEKSFLTELKEVLGLSKKVEVKLGMIKTESGEATLEYEGEILEAGVPVFIMSEDGEKVPAPVGDHKLEDGTTLVIAEEGITSEVKPTAMEEPKEEEMAQEPEAPNTQVETNLIPSNDDVVGQIKSLLIKYSNVEPKEVKENPEMVELKKEVETLKEEILKFKDAPASTPKKSQPTQPKAKQSLTEFLNNNL